MQRPMEPPEVRYARSGDVSIAYSVLGDGPFDVVFVSGWVLSTLADAAWESRAGAAMSSLASFCRLIIFDKRGTGLSDRSVGIPDLETRMDDIRAVMDAAGSTRAAVVGVSEGGPMSVLFAATYPERTAALVLYGTLASYVPAPDYPWAYSPEEWEDLVRRETRVIGTPGWLDSRLADFAPSVAGDEAERISWRRWVLASASPGAVVALRRMNTEIDVRHALSAIRVPTLVAQRRGEDEWLRMAGHYLADHIDGAELVEIDGVDHAWWYDTHQIVEVVQPFLEGIRDAGDWDRVTTDRVLATVLFTDIVDSTARLAELGDTGWREVIRQHHSLIRRQLARYSGREVDTAGDGFFASFDGPARAIRCAAAIIRQVRSLDLEIRAGLHTGECEIVDGKIGGIAVHIGARVAAQAEPGEILVSSTVKDLVAGSGLTFGPRGLVELKGVPGEWQLYAVEQPVVSAG